MVALFFRFTAWSGFASWRNLLSEKRQARAVAKKLLRTVWSALDPKDHKLIVDLPGSSYRLVDRKGHIEPCPRESLGI